MICAGSAGGVGRHAASFDANGGAGLRQEFAQRVLCKRQRSCISASRRFESALALFGSARMPVRVGKMRPTEPLPTMFAILLAALIAGLIHMRNCLAALFLGFHCCRVHCVLPVAGGGASGKWRSADGFHHAHFVHTAAGNIHPSVGRCRHIPRDSAPRRDGRARKAFRFRIERSWVERSRLTGQPQRIADRLEDCPLMMGSHDAIPIEKGM
jgi:hypothetical protein